MSGRGDGAQGRAGDGQLGLHDGAAQHQLRHLPPRADPRLARPQVARLRPSPLPERMLRRRPSGQRRRRGGGGHRNATSRAEWKCGPHLSAMDGSFEQFPHIHGVSRVVTDLISRAASPQRNIDIGTLPMIHMVYVPRARHKYTINSYFLRQLRV